MKRMFIIRMDCEGLDVDAFKEALEEFKSTRFFRGEMTVDEVTLKGE